MEVPRVPYTDPMTTRERINLRYTMKKWDMKSYFEWRLWQKIAHLLPRRIAYFAMVRLVSHAWVQEGTKAPDDLTYTDICRHWGKV